MLFFALNYFDLIFFVLTGKNREAFGIQTRGLYKDLYYVWFSYDYIFNAHFALNCFDFIDFLLRMRNSRTAFGFHIKGLYKDHYYALF